MSVFIAKFRPNDTSRVDDSRVNIWTWNVAEEANGELNNPHRHRLVFWMRASHDDQHTADFWCGMNEDGEREDCDENV